MNGRDATLAEIKSYHGAHHENFNEDRATPLADDYILVPKNINHADMRGDSIAEGRHV